MTPDRFGGLPRTRAVGMTGSGKTGLVTVMIEEAARAGVPTVVIDVKGDLPNLLARSHWTAGLSDRWAAAVCRFSNWWIPAGAFVRASSAWHLLIRGLHILPGSSLPIRSMKARGRSHEVTSRALECLCRGGCIPLIPKNTPDP
jgi:hypothetical protein